MTLVDDECIILTASSPSVLYKSIDILLALVVKVLGKGFTQVGKAARARW